MLICQGIKHFYLFPYFQLFIKDTPCSLWQSSFLCFISSFLVFRDTPIKTAKKWSVLISVNSFFVLAYFSDNKLHNNLNNIYNNKFFQKNFSFSTFWFSKINIWEALNRSLRERLEKLQKSMFSWRRMIVQ